MLELIYCLVGLMLLWFALLTFGDQQHPHRLATGSFWLLLGVLFGAGSLLPHGVAGLLVVLLVLLDGAGLVKAGPASPHLAQGSARLVLPILLMPATILAASLLCRWQG